MLKIVEKDNLEKELTALIKRREFVDDSKTEKSVRSIVADIKDRGDAALREYTKKFDKVDIGQFRVGEEEIKSAYQKADRDFISALRAAVDNITEFHKKQRVEEWFEPIHDDSVMGMRAIPLESAGIYVPGGRASYPSTVLMCAIPAKIAKVGRIVMVSPPKINPNILAAAFEVGISEVYRVGGAQAIAALAYGTESIPKVDKIVGPGNIYVTYAKKLVYGMVGLDSLAGPSDVLIIADEDSEPGFIASDILAQAEHDPDSCAILLTDSKKLALSVNKELEKQFSKIKRGSIAGKAITENSMTLLVDSLINAAEVANKIAPEHLEIHSSPPQKILEKIKNAGAVFLGPYTPVAAGDYAAGPNHVLPTGGCARFSSPLTVYDFIKRQSVLGLSKPALNTMKDVAKILAEAEEMDAHARSIGIRFGG